MPKERNNEWRICRLRRMLELLKEADEKQLDVVQVLIDVHTHPLRQKLSRVQGYKITHALRILASICGNGGTFPKGF